MNVSGHRDITLVRNYAMLNAEFLLTLCAKNRSKCEICANYADKNKFVKTDIQLNLQDNRLFLAKKV